MSSNKLLMNGPPKPQLRPLGLDPTQSRERAKGGESTGGPMSVSCTVSTAVVLCRRPYRFRFTQILPLFPTPRAKRLWGGWPPAGQGEGRRRDPAPPGAGPLGPGGPLRPADGCVRPDTAEQGEERRECVGSGRFFKMSVPLRTLNEDRVG